MVTEHLVLEVAAEQVNHLPLRPNTLEKSLPCFPWQLELLAKAFCNILSLLATCRMGLIFALQALLLWKWSLEAASKSYLMNFCSSWNLLRLYNETVELKKRTAERIIAWKSAGRGSNISVLELGTSLSLWCRYVRNPALKLLLKQ